MLAGYFILVTLLLQYNFLAVSVLRCRFNFVTSTNPLPRDPCPHVRVRVVARSMLSIQSRIIFVYKAAKIQ